MLTRAQAKTKECPYRISNMHALIEDFYKQHDTLLNGGDRETKAEAIQKAYDASMCIAEDCPKWRDISNKYENICATPKCPTYCGDEKCEKAFGRCGK